jgi:CHAT domain-containing protein
VRRGDHPDAELNPVNLDRWTNPYYWAAFSVYGNPNAKL